MTKTEKLLINFLVKTLKIIVLIKLLTIKSLVVFWESILRMMWFVSKTIAKEKFYIKKDTLPWWFWSVCVQVFITSIVPWYVWDYFYYSGYYA